MESNARTFQIFFVYVLIILLLVVFIFTIGYKSISQQKLSLDANRTDIAIRGYILSKDDFNLATSSRLYKVSINTKSIDPKKLDLFIKLFSIYADIPSEYIYRKFMQNTGYITLSYNVNENTAASLRRLNSKLLALNVFQEYEMPNGKMAAKMGIDVQSSGVSRVYPYKSTFEPILGYVKKYEDGTITRSTGVKGLERYYNSTLSPISDGNTKGKRDIGFNVILNRSARQNQRKDGFNIKLAIPLALQEKVEKILIEAKAKHNPKEIVAGILDPYTGELLSLASSNRFDPSDILPTEYANLNVSAVEKSYEPGSTIKPLIYAALLQAGKIKSDDSIYLNNGSYKISDTITISDTHKTAYTTMKNIIIKSSNIGMIKITQDLNGEEFNAVLRLFGLGSITGIDLPYEKSGILPNIRKMNNKVTKAALSYGYGLRSTFVQMLRAYAVFCNGGYLLTPHIVDAFIDGEGKYTTPTFSPAIKILNPTIAKQMQILLHEAVTTGTGKNANIKGLVVGGKTGTARIARNGRYIELYNGSFFGFVSDGMKTYVIGVLAFESADREDYYGSQTAAPVFKSIADLLVKRGYLELNEKN